MDDSLFDDVNSLLDGDFVDDRILKQIHRACKNNEVISNYERNYVQKLAEQYLGKKSKTPSNISDNTIPKIPDVVMPTIEPIIQTKTIQEPTYSKSKFNVKNSKPLLAFGGIALVIIIAAISLIANIDDSFSPNTSTENKITLSVNSDLSSYSQNDIISINGISENNSIVNLSIENQNNDLVWAEQTSVKSNGQYSTLAICGGSGWEISGTYTLKVDDGTNTKSITFSFTS
jgi:hypothetical protein